ncbi:MAG TPA: DUF5999 family protein [Streptosporangiaceae bacterium]|jgi:hypothetical protein|nr:DUF5999 family protein [Streptosporangiaceae bacterium]
MCQHQPPCPKADAIDHNAARLVAYHPEQGWGLLCNQVIVFDDSGELLPDGRTPAARRPQTELTAATVTTSRRAA